VASKKQRQRQLAKDAYERRLQRRAERDRRTKVWATSAISAVVVVGILVGSLVLAGVIGGSPTKPVANASKNPSAAVSATAAPSATASPTPTTALVNGKCVYTTNGAAAAAKKVSPPPATPDTKANYQATMSTNRGKLVIKLMNTGAPCTVNSFVSLADQKYFNATHCHRLTTSGIFVLQCGDPLGTGAGGPGYSFANENLNGLKLSTCPGSTQECATFPPGTVAMANSGGTATNGSQFFLVYKTTVLPDSYTPFGTIVSGLNIIQNVAKAGSDNSNGAGDGHPKEAVDISSVTIKKT